MPSAPPNLDTVRSDLNFLQFLRSSSALSPFAKRCDLVAVAARGHVAPPTVVRPGAVIKPQNTLIIFTAPYEAKVA
jgi:hypothetical protein